MGSEFRFIDYVKNYDIDNAARFDLIKKVLELCESNGIVLENTQPGAVIGMPWAILYKKAN
jgi:histidinol phosphatase-like PHP family hydrolase